jgi:type II secretory pathway component GspD/PulD (secretin)
VLGGLNQIFFTDDSNKVPILGNLPVLSFFFSSKNYQRQTRNLVLIVEPSLLDPEDPSALEQATKEARDRLRENTEESYLPLDGKKIQKG